MRFNSSIYYDRTQKTWPFNIGECSIDVTAWICLTLFKNKICFTVCIIKKSWLFVECMVLYLVVCGCSWKLYHYFFCFTGVVNCHIQCSPTPHPPREPHNSAMKQWHYNSPDLCVFYYTSASEIWHDKRSGICWKRIYRGDNCNRQFCFDNLKIIL